MRKRDVHADVNPKRYVYAHGHARTCKSNAHSDAHATAHANPEGYAHVHNMRIAELGLGLGE